MKSSFIDKLLIQEKNVCLIDVKQTSVPPESIAVRVGLVLQDVSDTLIAVSGDILQFVVGVQIQMFDASHPDFNHDLESDALEVFHCEVRFTLKLQVTDGIESSEPMPIAYSKEILSLVYDDIRICIDNLIRQSAFKGFSLPFDFREAFKDAVSADGRVFPTT